MQGGWRDTGTAFVALAMTLAPGLGTASCVVEELDVDGRFWLIAVRRRSVTVAVPAVVEPLASVHPFVAPQVRHLHEPFVADATAKGFFARVQSDVRLEVVVAGEALVTLRALVGLLAGVGPIVVLQYMFVVKRLVTQIARVFLF